jgi:hypothetical protein
MICACLGHISAWKISKALEAKACFFISAGIENSWPSGAWDEMDECTDHSRVGRPTGMPHLRP